jgi:uncharacterized protein
MSSILSFIRKFPLLTYFVLTFAISWGCILIVVGSDNLPIRDELGESLMPLLFPALLTGPCIAGLLLIGIVHSRAGCRDLLSRLLRWRVGAQWYAVAILTAPILASIALLVVLAVFPDSIPGIFTSEDKLSLLLFAVVAGLVTGILEELGWTGFAVPMLRQHYSILATGMIVGVMWGAWHFILFWEVNSFSGALPLVLLLVRLFVWPPAYRVLMIWVYDRTKSLPVAMIMHASLVIFYTFLLMPLATGTAMMIYILVWSALLWSFVVVLQHRLMPETRQKRSVMPG